MPGVGDDQLEAARLRDEALDGGRDLLAVADVGGQGDCPRAELAGQRGELVLRAGEQPDRGPAGGQRRRDRAADPARGARHDRPRRARSMRMRPEDMLKTMSQDQATRRRRGVPADDLLAAGGRTADDRRQRRPRHAALRPDRPRDDRAARARRLRHARPGQGPGVHRQRARARRGHRAPPPADRALPHRRAGHPVGRRARGGRAARARDVAEARGAHARRDRRRQDLSARTPDQPRRARRGRPARRRRSRAPR